MSFADLKRNRRSAIDKLVTEAEKVSGRNKNYDDNRVWKPTVDKAGNGYAVIRFLPAVDPDAVPWIQYWDHGFQGPTGRWYIEKSLTSLGQPDPVSDYNSQLWAEGEDGQALARKQKRRLHYVSNILVISDPAKPENEGKVFIYEYGKKIFDKIMDAMKPQFEDEQAINPYSLWDGANFKLKIRQVEGYRNYDKSEFDKDSIGPISESDEELEALYNKIHDTSEYLDPKTFKSYNVLLKKLNDVIGEVVIRAVDDKPSEPEPKHDAPAPVKETPEASVSGEPAADDDEEMDSFFAGLTAGDDDTPPF